jgi:hypothetical protein
MYPLPACWIGIDNDDQNVWLFDFQARVDHAAALAFVEGVVGRLNRFFNDSETRSCEKVNK